MNTRQINWLMLIFAAAKTYCLTMELTSAITTEQ